MKCLVLDYGGTALKYGLIDTDANLTEQGRSPLPITRWKNICG